jgi:GT2 family glycosyltransferase
LDACVSVIIPVWNRVELTLSCLTSLSEQDAGAAFELIVVDNGSTDATPDQQSSNGLRTRLASVRGSKFAPRAKITASLPEARPGGACQRTRPGRGRG